MPEPVQLRPQATPRQDPVEIPEVLFVSALLDTGQFTPDAHRVDVDTLAAYERVFTFCLDHQLVAKCAPAIDLVQRRYPDFPYVPDVNLAWASDQLHRAAHHRTIRRSVRELLRAQNSGDDDLVAQIITDMPAKAVSGKLTGLASTDYRNAEVSGPKHGLPVPWPALQIATDGIGASELWFLLARWGIGKTYVATKYAAVAAEAGAVVRYLSAEMPAWKINRRINLHYAANEPALQAALRSGDVAERRAALDVIAQLVPGRVETADWTDTPMRVSVLEELSDGADLVIVDHAGLLADRKGNMAVQDWRVMAEISITMLRTKNTTGVPILAVVQANKEGDSKGWNTPRGVHIGQSQQQGMDAEFIIALNRPDEGKVMVHQMRKNRENELARWFTRYNPNTMDFEEISKDQAEAQHTHDLDATDW